MKTVPTGMAHSSGPKNSIILFFQSLSVFFHYLLIFKSPFYDIRVRTGIALKSLIMEREKAGGGECNLLQCSKRPQELSNLLGAPKSILLSLCIFLRVFQSVCWKSGDSPILFRNAQPHSGHPGHSSTSSSENLHPSRGNGNALS